tara:strand:- start:27785 stop:28078 length:294 start_codon:yes stop_codon:yes gene_type:complete
MNNDKQRREDTRYVQWQDGMYVMLDDLECDYELALVEDSLRDSVYFQVDCYFCCRVEIVNCIGVYGSYTGYWDYDDELKTKLTRAQALYIATGDVSI